MTPYPGMTQRVFSGRASRHRSERYVQMSAYGLLIVAVAQGLVTLLTR